MKSMGVRPDTHAFQGLGIKPYTFSVIFQMIKIIRVICGLKKIFVLTYHGKRVTH